MLFSILSDCQNKHLIWASEYIQRFCIKIWYKTEWINYISDILLKLSSYWKIHSLTEDKEILDIFFSEIYVYVIILVKINNNFKICLIADYSVNKSWAKIWETLKINKIFEKSD